MEAIEFTLWGTGASFKRPYINTVYLTYSNIHKVALLGLLGAVIGLKGHPQKTSKERYPEFYNILNGLRVGIIPEKPIFQKDIKIFTESTGFFNKGSSGPATSIYKEQFIIAPKWDIYIMQGTIDNKVYEKLKYALLNHEAVFDPYLGKNHFPASINNVKIVNLDKPEDVHHIHSIFQYDKYVIDEEIADKENDSNYCIKEYMPVRLTPNLNYYDEEEMCLTNIYIKGDMENIYEHEEKNIYFI